MPNNNPFFHIRTELKRIQGSLKLVPLPNQVFDTNLHISASREHQEYPLGTIFEVKAKEVTKSDGAQYLYVNWRDGVEVVNK